MAELVGLLASIAGATTAGIQISKILYSAVRTVRDLEEEVSSVAREVTVLSSAFDEISNAIQAGNEDGLRVSSAAILTIADLVKDSQDVYSKIRRAVDNQPGMVSQARWIFRRQDVAVWSAKVSKNISLLNLMMTTLLWARTRRAQATMIETQTLSSTEPAPVQTTRSRPSLELPARIQEQVVQTVLCVENLDKLEEDNSDSAIRLDFATGPDLEPRHYVYEPHIGALRRILPDSASLWLSEMVNIGDDQTLSGRTMETVQEEDNVCEPDKGGLAHATELADRLVQDWTNLTVNEDTMAWEAVTGANEVRQLELLSLGNNNLPGLSETHPRILISTFEFAIDECNINVISTHMGGFSEALSRSMGISEVTWVIPRLQDVHYPVDATKTKCLKVQVDGMEIKANALSLRRGRIHYIIIECEGMMGDLSKGRPYPNDMETETTAKFFSFWNQCVAMVIRATSPDIYLMIDSRSALAPYYLDYPICCCVALVELRHQGKWMLLNTAEDMEKWRKIFNLERQVFSPIYNEMCTSSYLDWRSLTTGSASHMNFLHAAAQYMHRYQNGYGNKIIRSLPDLWNPGVAVRGHKDDTMARAQRRLGQVLGLRTSTSQTITTGEPSGHGRPDLRNRAGRKQKAQEWAGLENNSSGSLFIWIGGIMAGAGAEYLPDVIEGFLLQRTSVQCIVFGLVWDALGEAAAYDLLRVQSLFPGRLCVKLESVTKVPSYVWDGADFAFNLIMIKPWNVYPYAQAYRGAVVVGFRPDGFPRRSGFFFADSGILTLRKWTRSQIIRDCIRVSIEAADSTEATRNELRDAAYPVEDWKYMVARTVQEVLDLCNMTYRQAISPQGFPEASEQVQKVEREIQEFIELGPRLG